MAETENGTRSDTAILQELLGEVRALGAIVAEWHEEFQRYSPVLEAYLRPDASGPVAWAIRRQHKKAGQHGQD